MILWKRTFDNSIKMKQKILENIITREFFPFKFARFSTNPKKISWNGKSWDRDGIQNLKIKILGYSDSQLYATIFDLWLAGQETTSNTLAWLVIYLVQYPQIQTKLHHELDHVIGNDRMITLDDKSSLNYVNAVVAETQRFCNLVPVNIFHKITKDIEIGGYKFPKDTTITHQISTVLMDERYFPEPESFKPERFLDKNGKFFQPPELMPFGVGKRACLGEGLARLELFLFAANIFNHFKVVLNLGF